MSSSSIGIIGGADGPTSIIVTGFPIWILIGVGVVVLMMLCGVVYAIAHRGRDEE